LHLHFVGTEQRNGSLRGQQLDFRSAGGYVLVPPSYLDTGAYAGFYRWERPGEPDARLDWSAVTDLLNPLPARPGVQPLKPRPPRQGWDVNTLAAAVEREPKGNRNNLLFWAFCEALRCGYDLRLIAEAALRNPCKERITVREVEATWRQAVKRVARDGQAGRPSVLTPAHRTLGPADPGRAV
jgi:hypothetical protein